MKNNPEMLPSADEVYHIVYLTAESLLPKLENIELHALACGIGGKFKAYLASFTQPPVQGVGEKRLRSLMKEHADTLESWSQDVPEQIR